jgi:hypothetical protein
MTAIRHHAEGWVNVTSYDPKPYDETGGLSIFEVHIAEEFTGDFAGTGTVRFLMVSRADGSS